MHNCDPKRAAFTLVELLVVIGVIAVLLGLLLPVLAAARQSARDVRCLNNVRQVATAMIDYATAFHGKFPPNSAPLGQFWYSGDVLRGRLAGCRTLSDGTLAGGVLACPNDHPDAVRSYSMNTWASSVVSDFVQASTSGDHPRGRLFQAGVSQGSRMLLVIEAFSAPIDDVPENPIAAPAVVGWAGRTAGARFGAGDGVPHLFGGTLVNSQLTYARHRTRADARKPLSLPAGRLNAGFADGHAQLLRADELANFTSGRSTYTAMWSTIDRAIDDVPAD